MAWVGKRPARRLGGMADALTMAADLGFPVPVCIHQIFPRSMFRYFPFAVRTANSDMATLKHATCLPSSALWMTAKSPPSPAEQITPPLAQIPPKPSTAGAGQRVRVATLEIAEAEKILQDTEGAVAEGGKGKGANEEALVRVLRELSTVQRNLANLQVELQGRQDDERVAHLTHVSEIKKKSEALAKTTATLQDVIHNKDRIIARLQQPYSLDCIPVETEYQRQFSELLLKAAGDYGALTASTTDIHWTQNFKEPPSVWGELLRPIPTALAACTRYYEALSTMRDAVSALHQARVRGPLTPVKDNRGPSGAECITPATSSWNTPVEEPSSDDVLMRSRRQLQMQMATQDWAMGIQDPQTELQYLESMKPRRMSWPPSPSAGAVL